ncbi:class I SAM-dependent methyltransferase [Roseivirga sp.]|uniref:class I SAM-dependent methyltransferase n=1 Tax=Roseivirga sp. TaxID=1964215 RepID=UPI003B8CA284
MKSQFLRLSENKGSLGDFFRAKRFKFFEQCIRGLPKPVKILDVGGKESFWTNRGYDDQKNIQITLVNLEKELVQSSNMISLAGDATDLSSFKNNEFDVVFSNSVIEHLYTLESQRKMAQECSRVGHFYFIQTPNKHFFLEPHFRFPFFNKLPHSIAYFILTKTKLSLGQKWKPENAQITMDEIRLLSKNEFKGLFKHSEIYIEWFLIFRKSFTLHNFNIEK